VYINLTTDKISYDTLDSPVSLNKDFELCKSIEDFKKCADKTNLKYLNRKDDEKIVIVKERFKNNVISTSTQFNFKNGSFINLNIILKLYSRNSVFNFEYICVFLKKYFKNRDFLIEKMLTSRNLKDYLELDGELAQNYDLFDDVYLFNIINNPKCYLNKNIEIEKLIPLKLLKKDLVGINLFMNDINEKDELSLSVNLSSGEIKKNDISFKDIKLVFKEEGFKIKSISFFNNKIYSLYSGFDDLFKVYHKAYCTSILPLNITRRFDNGLLIVEFEDSLNLKMKTIKLPDLFSDYGFNNFIKMDKDLKKQFYINSINKWDDFHSVLFNALKNENFNICNYSNFKNISASEFYSLLEFNINHIELEEINNKVKNMILIYNHLKCYITELNDEVNFISFMEKSGKSKENLEKKTKKVSIL
jgi:hypothetical protein